MYIPAFFNSYHALCLIVLYVYACRTLATDTLALDIRLPYLKIPAKKTCYVCHQFKVPDDVPYHIVRFQPLINNTRLVHHILLFGCDFKIDTEGPHECDSMDNRCRTWLVKWDMGMTGNIVMPSEAGVRFGKDSFKYIGLQIHWNNRDESENETDSSGMRLFYTSTLRKYDMGNVQIGQNSIDIPAETKELSITGACSSSCTSVMLPRAVHISDVYMHMHSLGKQAAIDIQRDREVIDRLAFEDNYDFRIPKVHSLNLTGLLNPGDELRLTCWYDSMTGPKHRNTTVSFGQGSDVRIY